jgi:hypothetical protein
MKTISHDPEQINLLFSYYGSRNLTRFHNNIFIKKSGYNGSSLPHIPKNLLALLAVYNTVC